MWERMERFLQAVVPAAEQAGVVMALHPDDPPIPEPLAGVAQICSTLEQFRKTFFELAPSDNNRMLFCQGCVTEMGVDVYEAIRRIGSQDRIVYVHFRNVQGTIPAQKGYAEVIPDDGDLDMYQVARALHQVGYEGAIDYDHIMGISTATPVGREYIAFCVGHARGMLQGLANSR